MHVALTLRKESPQSIGMSTKKNKRLKKQHSGDREKIVLRENDGRIIYTSLAKCSQNAQQSTQIHKNKIAIISLTFHQIQFCSGLYSTVVKMAILVQQNRWANRANF